LNYPPNSSDISIIYYGYAQSLRTMFARSLHTRSLRVPFSSVNAGEPVFFLFHFLPLLERGHVKAHSMYPRFARIIHLCVLNGRWYPQAVLGRPIFHLLVWQPMHQHHTPESSPITHVSQRTHRLLNRKWT